MHKNPFVAGRWVYDKQFFGRQEIIENLLNSNELCDWVIGKRRIGKTSLLRHLEYLVNENEDDRFALFWDVQGSYDIPGLQDSLYDAIEDNQDLFPDKWENFEFELEEGQPCYQLLKGLARAHARQGSSLLLLIDEAEEFINIRDKAPLFLDKLRKFFQKSQNVHTIICSTPRLEQLHHGSTGNTSPFLHGFHPTYLGNLEHSACRALLERGVADGAIVEKIIALTDCNPFETQLFGKHLYELEDFDQVSAQLTANPSLNQVIEVNYDLLNPEEQELMKDVFRGRLDSIHGVSPQELTLITKLRLMGYLHEETGNLRISSDFHLRWIENKLEERSGAKTVQASDAFLTPGADQAITSQVLVLYKVFLELAQSKRRLKDVEDCFKVSGVDQSAYPVKDIDRHCEPTTIKGRPWQTAIRELAAFLKRYLSTNAEQWSLFRFFQMVDAEVEQYSENDFLDILILISEEARLN